MSTISLKATARTDTGKGASRRLRRQQLVPAIVYGGSKKPALLNIAQNVLFKALENEAIYSSVFSLDVDGKKESVILKALQRHPYKTVIMHMDLQRVAGKDVLTKLIPLHFINEDTCKGVKAGGIINHSETQIEVRCKAKDLPEFIEVDMAEVALDQTVHYSELVLPKGVELTADLSDSAHDHPIVAVHKPKIEVIEDESSEEAVDEEIAADEDAETPAQNDSKE